MRVSIRVLLISPRALICAGLAALLSGQPQIEIGGAVDHAHIIATDFDIALWDVSSRDPQNAPFRFLALLRDSNDARAWLDAGAAGIVLETSSAEELLDAIRQSARGEIYLPPPIAKQVVASRAVRGASRGQPIEPLTDREREVLRLLAQGMSNKNIAQKLYLSVRTVEGYLANIYGKLQVKSRTEAALWAIENL